MDFRAMFPRHFEALLSDALADTLVVLLNGAHQTGKTPACELFKHLAWSDKGLSLSHYRTQ